MYYSVINVLLQRDVYGGVERCVGVLDELSSTHLASRVNAVCASCAYIGYFIGCIYNDCMLSDLQHHL